MVNDGLRQAIKIIGNQTALANKIEVSVPRLNQWLNGKSNMSLCYALRIVEVSQVTIESLFDYLNPQDKEVILKQITDDKAKISSEIKRIKLTEVKPKIILSVLDPLILELAEHIKNYDLMRPILLDSSLQIIDGHKRYFACLHNKLETIDAKIIDIEQVLQNSDFEFDFKYLLHSERIAVGNVLESHIGERRGRENPVNFPEYYGQETRAIVSNKLGYSNCRAYTQVKYVVKNGVPVLAELLDEKRLSVSSAFAIAALPAFQQEAIISHDISTIIAIAKKLKNKPKKENSTDKKYAWNIQSSFPPMLVFPCYFELIPDPQPFARIALIDPHHYLQPNNDVLNELEMNYIEKWCENLKNVLIEEGVAYIFSSTDEVSIWTDNLANNDLIILQAYQLKNGVTLLLCTKVTNDFVIIAKSILENWFSQNPHLYLRSIHEYSGLFVKKILETSSNLDACFFEPFALNTNFGELAVNYGRSAILLIKNS